MNFKNMSLFLLLLMAGFVGTIVNASEYYDEKADLTKEFEVKMDPEKKLEIKEGEVGVLKELLAIDKQLVTGMKVYDDIREDCRNDCWSRENQDQDISNDSIEACAYMWSMGRKEGAIADAIDSVRKAIMKIKHGSGPSNELSDAIADEQE